MNLDTVAFIISVIAIMLNVVILVISSSSAERRFYNRMRKLREKERRDRAKSENKPKG